jgi:hypothetical protein
MSESYDFGGYISWSSTTKEQILRKVDICRKPEIDDDWFEISLANHNVLRLQVSVHHSIFAKMAYPLQQPSNYYFYFFLT